MDALKGAANGALEGIVQTSTQQSGSPVPAATDWGIAWAEGAADGKLHERSQLATTVICLCGKRQRFFLDGIATTQGRTAQMSEEHPNRPAIAAVEHTAPSGQRPEAPQVDFPPVRNGIDYLRSVIDHLSREKRDARDLKYAVLHLQAATEVLLKARLQEEHWSLVFDNPLVASREDLASGDFSSCGVTETISRLERFANVHLEVKHVRAIKNLTQDRNKLQHYGLTHNARAIEARATEVLHFLLDFVHLELVRHIDRDEWDRISFELDHVRHALGDIEGFVSRRMNDLKADIAEVADHIIQCPDCGQWAAIVLHGVRCTFCHLVLEPAEHAVSWGPNSWRSDNSNASASAEPTSDCPQCGRRAFIGSIFFETAREKPQYACFHCQYKTDTAHCARCSRPFPADGNRCECGTCQSPTLAVPEPRNSD